MNSYNKLIAKRAELRVLEAKVMGPAQRNGGRLVVDRVDTAILDKIIKVKKQIKDLEKGVKK